MELPPFGYVFCRVLEFELACLDLFDSNSSFINTSSTNFDQAKVKHCKAHLVCMAGSANLRYEVSDKPHYMKYKLKKITRILTTGNPSTSISSTFAEFMPT